MQRNLCSPLCTARMHIFQLTNLIRSVRCLSQTKPTQRMRMRVLQPLAVWGLRSPGAWSTAAQAQSTTSMLATPWSKMAASTFLTSTYPERRQRLWLEAPDSTHGLQPTQPHSRHSELHSLTHPSSTAIHDVELRSHSERVARKKK